MNPRHQKWDFIFKIVNELKTHSNRVELATVLHRELENLYEMVEDSNLGDIDDE